MDYLRLVRSIIKKYSSKPIFQYNPLNRNLTDLMKLVENGQDLIARNAYLDINSTRNRTLITESLMVCKEAYLNLKNRQHQQQSSFLIGVFLMLAKDPLNVMDDKLIEKIIKHDIYQSVIGGGAQIIIIWSLFKRFEVKRTYGIQYKAYESIIKEINNLKIVYDYNKTIDLSYVLLQSANKIIEYTQDYLYTHAEYHISDTSTLVFDINSSNYPINDKKNNISLEPFQVKFQVKFISK